MFNILLKNGLVCDGSGEKPFKGDVAIKDGKIAEVAVSIQSQAETILDVSGLVVSPAFIDMHSHSDRAYFHDDRCESKINQGVATEVIGQCGDSLFPRSQEQMTRLKNEGPEDKSEEGEHYQSKDFKSLRERAKADGHKMSTNLIQLIGHNSIRRGVVGLSGRASSSEENKLSAYLLDKNLEQGTWGLSLGLGYMPGIFSDINELVELGKVCCKHNVVITSHMRNEADLVHEAVDEMIRINRESGAAVHIAHLKISSTKRWGTADKLYEQIEKARQNGVAITADMYPYNASSTGITNVLPGWAMEGGSDETVRRLTKPGEERDKLYAHLCDRYPTKVEGDRVYVISTRGRYPEADDKTMGELSEELNLSVPDTIMRTLIETKCRADGIFYSMHEDDVAYLLSKDIAIGSDGVARPYDPAKNNGKPHPRAFGTFPRFLRLRREKNICPIETAIYRMTKKPAGIVGLKNRGLLAPSYIADITVFDESKVSDTATFKNPFQKPLGIVHVLMNGRFAIRDGCQTDERLGDYLLR